MWEPDPSTLSSLAVLFQQSNDGHREKRAERSEARRQLESAREQPDLVKYLVFLLVSRPPNSVPEATDEIRATSGLWLKNVLVFDWFRLNPDAVSYVQQKSTTGLSDPTQLIRNASSIVVTTLLSKVGIQGWPALLPELVNAIDQSQSGDPIQEGAVSALKNICEDSASVVAQDEDLFSQLVPKLISFTKSPSARVRSYSIACLTEFVPLGSMPFLVHIDDFLLSCFTLAQSDSNPETLQSICRAFTELLQVRPDKLIPHMQGVVQFAVHCLKSSEESVALEGAEFLLALSESDADEETLQPLLPHIIEPLLSSMVFSDDDLFVLDSVAEDDSQEADRDQDIKPQHPKHRNKHHQASGSGEKDGDESDDEDDDDLEASLEDWNLRKCSAGTLDQLAQKLPNQVLELALPVLLQRINNTQEWPVRESAVLAFGAIATGVIQAGETGFVPELIPFLVSLLKDEHASIREISCWTLSRYVQEDQLQLDLLQAVLGCMLDVNKRVQAAACAALSTLSENSGGQLEPLASDLFQHLRLCFTRYQKNNLLALYECIQTVATAVSNAIKNQPDIVDYVMEPMLARWEAVNNEDYELLALLEAFGFLAIAIGPSFSKFAAPLFERSVLLIRDSLVLIERAQIDPVGVDAPEPMVVACGIDMIDGLVQALGSSGMAPLFAAQQQSTQTTIVDLLLMCLGGGINNLDIKQSSLSLIGDLAVYCFDDQLLPYCAQIVPEIVQLIDTNQIINDAFYEPVGDNSMWALAEISMHHQKFSLEPWFNDIFQKLGSVMCSPEVYSSSLLWNAAIAIGRLGLGSAHLLAPHLQIFIAKWLEIIMDVDATAEKDTALQGMCLTIAANPSALNENTLQQFLKVLAGYFTPSPDLKELVGKVVEGYKGVFPQFHNLVGTLPPAFQQQLKLTYPM